MPPLYHYFKIYFLVSTLSLHTQLTTMTEQYTGTQRPYSISMYTLTKKKISMYTHGITPTALYTYLLDLYFLLYQLL